MLLSQVGEPVWRRVTAELDVDALIMLGGSVGNLLGHPPATGHTGSHPYAIRAALADGGTTHDIATDVMAAAAAIDGTPVQPVRFLALVISRGPLPAGAAHPDYLLATPLYVEAAGDPGL
jgi:hypothetical protein